MSSSHDLPFITVFTWQDYSLFLAPRHLFGGTELCRSSHAPIICCLDKEGCTGWMTAIVKLKVAWFVAREVGVRLNICTVAWLEREDNSLASSFSFVNHHYNTTPGSFPAMPHTWLTCWVMIMKPRNSDRDGKQGRPEGMSRLEVAAWSDLRIRSCTWSLRVDDRLRDFQALKMKLIMVELRFCLRVLMQHCFI